MWGVGGPAISSFIFRRWFEIFFGPRYVLLFVCLCGVVFRYGGLLDLILCGVESLKCTLPYNIYTSMKENTVQTLLPS